jgi:hypothetical protein
MKTLVLAAALLAILGGCATSETADVPVVNTLVVTAKLGDMPVGGGSAVVLTIDSGCRVTAITARHVVANPQLETYWLAGSYASVRAHPSLDVAAIRAKLPACDGLHPLYLVVPRHGDVLFSTGYVSQGDFLSVQRGLYYPSPAPGGEVMLPLSAYYGMSGGGVYTADGGLFGIVTGGSPAYTSMGRVLPVTAQILRDLGISQET